MDNKELINALRSIDHMCIEDCYYQSPLFSKAADTIDLQEAEIARLRAALKPFADEANQWEGFDDSDMLVESWEDGPLSTLKVGDLRAARAVYQTEKNEND